MLLLNITAAVAAALPYSNVRIRLFMLSNVKIGTRLGISFALIISLLLIMVFISLARVKDLTDTNENLINNELSNLILTSDINTKAEAATINLLMILATPNRDQRIPLYKEMDASNARMDELLTKLSNSSSILSDDKQRIISRRESFQASYQETVETLELDSETAVEQFNRDTRPALEAFLEAVSELASEKQQSLLREHQATVSSSENSSRFIFALIIFTSALAGFLAYVVRRSITHPINEAVLVAQKIADGTLQAPPVTHGKDEVHDLMESFRLMYEGLRDLIVSIQHSTGTVRDSTNQLAKPVESVQRGSQNQRDALNRIDDLVSNFAQESSRSINVTHQAKERSDKARKLAVEGNSLIEQATKEFHKISTTISHSADAVAKLSERAVSVRNLVSTVREIAEQTNLLALNAAIEAARAGETGRGFSVVADEVRGLANRTEQSTKEINDVIDAMDSETNHAVEQITNGQKELEGGVATIQRMVQPLSDLNEDSQASFSALEELERTVASQAEGSQEIQKNISDIGELATRNLDAASEVSQITGTLTDISRRLGEHVMQFSIR